MGQQTNDRMLTRFLGRRCRRCQRPTAITSAEGGVLVLAAMEDLDHDLCRDCTPGEVGDIVGAELAQHDARVPTRRAGAPAQIS